MRSEVDVDCLVTLWKWSCNGDVGDRRVGVTMDISPLDVGVVGVTMEISMLESQSCWSYNGGSRSC